MERGPGGPLCPRCQCGRGSRRGAAHLASAEAAGLELEPRQLDLGRLAADAADSLASRFWEGKVKVEQDLPPTPILGDPRRLHQIVTNLLSNAAKYTPPGGKVMVRAGR